ncbi:MAG: ATP synthase subunit I [Burkholderiaceae bacterium]|nr:ATP synthase subunit I [Burkholderiaceae bacterium]
MSKIAYGDQEEAQEPEIRRLSAQDVRELREKNPPVSPWRVIAGQVMVGLLVALAAWLLTGRQSVGWSAGYGALAVVLPAGLFARGLTGQFASLNPATAMMGFFVWEMVKIALTVAMLLAAPRLIQGLSWPAMLAGLVVTMQVYWAAPMLAPRKTKHRDE